MAALADYLGAPTRKDHFAGTHRGRRPEQTWELVAPLLPRFGITRVADISGLDRIGIPVWMAVRPNSRSLATTQGKGITPMLARVSAVMEAIEIAHAEAIDAALRLGSYDDMRKASRVVDVAALPPLRTPLFTPALSLPWIEAHDLVGGTSVWVPYECVHADATLPWPIGSGCFLASTNGLASGNTLAEAVLHGLCEVIERDAIAVWEHAGAAHQEATRIDLATATSPEVRAVMARFAAAGVVAMAWDITSDVGVPAVRAVIADAEADAELRPMYAAFGSGCHPDPNVALLRALTEAAQSRLTGIAGSRDDLSRALYRSAQAAQSLAYHRERARRPGVVAVASAPAWHEDTVDGDIARTAARLAAIGLSQILVVDLGWPEVPVAVARVIVPGLEGSSESPSYTPGPRAQAAARRGGAA